MASRGYWKNYDYQEHTTEALMPKFMAEHKAFLLTLYNLNYVEGNEKSDNTANDGNIQENIIEAIKVNNTNSVKQLSELINVSQRIAKRNIK